jgi:hypothetical protein
MNIFDLHRDVLAHYRDFVRSFLVIADEQTKAYAEADYFKRNVRTIEVLRSRVSVGDGSGEIARARTASRVFSRTSLASSASRSA